MTEASRDVVFFLSGDEEVAFPFDAERETIWASQAQIQSLFGVDQSGVSRHIRNVFASEEVDAESNMQKVHIASADRPVTLYSLDVVLAVGYRANSGRAIEFRRWASGVLKQYFLEGVAVNDRRLEQLGQMVQVLSRAADPLVSGIVDVLTEFIPGLTLLRDYDEGHIEKLPGVTPGWTLDLEEARAVIADVAREFPDDGLLGKERGSALEGVIGTIYQGFAGHELYPTVEEKAANLLYLIVKDHPLSDGNKRSGAALFVTFLARNGILRGKDGQPRIANNALAALTLMVAMSEPKEKDLMTALLVRMISEDSK